MFLQLAVMSDTLPPNLDPASLTANAFMCKAPSVSSEAADKLQEKKKRVNGVIRLSWRTSVLIVVLGTWTPPQASFPCLLPQSDQDEQRTRDNG